MVIFLLSGNNLRRESAYIAAGIHPENAGKACRSKGGMYRKSERTPDLPDFILPFEGKLDPENRWVKLAKLIPWEGVEADYAKSFKATGKGEKALNVRVALGALLI